MPKQYTKESWIEELSEEFNLSEKGEDKLRQMFASLKQELLLEVGEDATVIIPLSEIGKARLIVQNQEKARVRAIINKKL